MLQRECIVYPYCKEEKAMYDKMFPKALETFQRVFVRQIVIYESYPNVRFKRPWTAIRCPCRSCKRDIETIPVRLEKP